MSSIAQLPGLYPSGRQKQGPAVVEVRLWHDSRVEKKFVNEFLSAWDYVVSLGGEASARRIGFENLGSFSKGDRPFQSADWFIENAYDGGAVSAGLLSDSLIDDPRRFALGKKRIETEGGTATRRILKNEISGERTINLVLISHDLRLSTPRASGEDYALGCRMGNLVMVQTKRAKQMYGEKAPLVVRVQSVHELAHLFGAPSPSRKGDRINGVEECVGLHCKRADCALGKVNWPGRPDALEAAEKVLARAGKGEGYLCGACERDVKNGIAAFVAGMAEPGD
ncbi:Uncharacterised protein [uncultured archaeon]|nr:Uncharacterised protein [uncultured archaeon]